MIQETRERLQAINTVLTSSITTWNLVDRLRRLSSDTYHYRESNLIDDQVYGLRAQNKTPPAILALNDNALELPRDLSSLQIHCLCVHADYQRQGLRQHLIENALKLAQMRHLNAVLVKSHESTVSYFEKQGFRLTPVIDEVCDFPYRLVRSVI
ncbi:MAG: GNAT family N-acetyltransferase [Pseudomonadota bacterium]|nr:GNAT family N-acetyltransferase [Pseudomonadota bacterium]